MNKTILIAASAALLLAGCAKNELAPSAVEAETGSGVITFTTYTGRAVTKAGTDLNQSFNVEAFLTSTKAKYFDATDYTYASGNYTGAVTHYWPLSGSLDFYAVSPLKYRNTSGNDVTLAVSDSTFTVTATDGRTDIVAAKKTSQAKVDAVALQFGHKLTKVCFKAVGADTTKTYKIDSIKVTANSTGKYNYSPTESWSDAGTSYSYSFLKTRKTIPAKTKNATAVGDTLYLIPSQGASVKAKISYTVFEGATKIDSTATPIEVDLPAGIWGINKSIAYVLTLNFTSSASPITFSATETGWDTEVQDTVEVPQPIVFSVSATKKVKFTKGNLYWDGSAWKVEAKQYDFRHMNGLSGDAAVINGSSNTTPSGTVGSLFWTKTAAASYAASYDDGTCTSTDKFFCDGSDADHTLTIDGQGGLYALSSDEWIYLIGGEDEGGTPYTSRDNATSLREYGVTVAGQNNCLIIAPDGYSGTIEASYDVAAWTAAESAGLVCLPAAGSRDGSGVADVGTYGHSWSSTPFTANMAYIPRFNDSEVFPATGGNRNCGYPVRLVYSAQ